MLYITGDTHGIGRKWVNEIEAALKADDTIIICGDYGFGFWGGCREKQEMYFDYVAAKPYSVLFVDGNHENFDLLTQYRIERWNGGVIHRIRHNIIHLMRGEVYTIEGKTIFTFGGGYSIDKEIRTPHESWWEQEMPSEAEYRNAEANLAAVGNKVDYIITHTAPSEMVYRMSLIRSLRVNGNVYEEMPLTNFLNYLQDKVTYKHWYFGHFHIDCEFPTLQQTAIFNCIKELESGETVREWDTYEGQ